jgi:hypothetical protein
VIWCRLALPPSRWRNVHGCLDDRYEVESEHRERSSWSKQRDQRFMIVVFLPMGYTDRELCHEDRMHIPLTLVECER